MDHHRHRHRRHRHLCHHHHHYNYINIVVFMNIIIDVIIKTGDDDEVGAAESSGSTNHTSHNYS